MPDIFYNEVKEDEQLPMTLNESVVSTPFRREGLSQISKQKVSEIGGFIDFFAVGDSSIINNFADFTSSVTGSASITKELRLNYVNTGATQNSVAKVYKTINVENVGWSMFDGFKMFVNYYMGENWTGGATPGAKIWIKFGTGTNADEGGIADKVFGVRFEEVSTSGNIKATAFGRNGATVGTEVILSSSIQNTDKFNIGIIYSSVSPGNNGRLDFYLNDEKKGEISLYLDGAPTPIFSHIATNAVAGSSADGSVHQVFFLFVGTNYESIGRIL